MEKMRKEFEEFIAKEFQFSDQPRNDGSYRCTKINDLWKSWKASRAALCVEVSKAYQQGGMMADYLAESALEESGVSYK